MELLTIAEAAEELDLSYMSVYRFCISGRLGQQVGRAWVITREELDQFKATPRPPGRPRKRRNVDSQSAGTPDAAES